MNDERYEALSQQHLPLRAIAQRVIDAAGYDEDARVYRAKLRDLERELRGEPQPQDMAWMSVS